MYAHRVADVAKISIDAMKREVEKAYKRRQNRQKKQQEAIDLAPAKALQPKSRNIRYDNMRSAMAEETIIAMTLRQPALLDLAKDLKPGMFSSSLLGRVYDQLRLRHSQGLEVSLGVLSDLTADEASHMAGICQRQDGPVNEQAYLDCIQIIRSEYDSAAVSSEDDLLAYRDKLKKSKGIKA